MPKSQIVEPAEERKAGSIPFAEIPLNQYQQDLAKEKEAYGADALVGMYEDMLLIREFESMLQSIKTQGSYEGIEYDHKGPAHLSIGQEASAVGQAFLLDVDDHIPVLTAPMEKFSPRVCLRYASLMMMRFWRL